MTTSLYYALMQQPIGKNTEKNPPLPEEKEKEKYMYITRPDLECPPQSEHYFCPSIFFTVTHPKHKTSNC